MQGTMLHHSTVQLPAFIQSQLTDEQPVRLLLDDYDHIRLMKVTSRMFSWLGDMHVLSHFTKHQQTQSVEGFSGCKQLLDCACSGGLSPLHRLPSIIATSATCHQHIASIPAVCCPFLQPWDAYVEQGYIDFKPVDPSDIAVLSAMDHGLNASSTTELQQLGKQVRSCVPMQLLALQLEFQWPSAIDWMPAIQQNCGLGLPS